MDGDSIPQYHRAKSGSHEACENIDITFFTRHATIVSLDHIYFKFSRHGLSEVKI